MISLIAAVANQGAMSYQGQLPWRMPADLRYFKKMTLGKPVIMGRKTFESINSKPLPKRPNIVITRNLDYDAPGCTVVHSLAAALTAAKDHPEIMIVGGAEIYRQALPLADRLYLTFIDAEVKADTFFPDWSRDDWQETASETHLADEENEYDYRYVTFEK